MNTCEIDRFLYDIGDLVMLKNSHKAIILQREQELLIGGMERTCGNFKNLFGLDFYRRQTYVAERISALKARGESTPAIRKENYYYMYVIGWEPEHFYTLSEHDIFTLISKGKGENDGK